MKTDLTNWEVIRKTGWTYNKSDMENVLRCALSIDSLSCVYHRAPELFDFNSLTIEQKVLLVNTDYATFSTHIMVEELPRKYIFSLFIGNPTTFSKYLELDKLTKSERTEIAIKRPILFQTYNIKISSISGRGWENLLAYDDYYKSTMIDYIYTFRNKTEIRRLLANNTDLLPMLTINTMSSSVLLAKEWAMFLVYPEVVKSGQTYNTEVLNWLEQEITIEVLAGEKNSSKLKVALAIVKSGV